MKQFSNERSNAANGHRCQTTLGEITESAIQQAVPDREFVYLDIGSVDRESKHFNDLKLLSPNDAPSRARQVVKQGDVLVSMTRPNLNAVAMVPDRGDYFIASTGFHVLRSRWVNPRYLYYLVQSEAFIEAMSALVQGALYPAVRPKDIAGFEFELPPQNEQTRIVEKVEELLSDLDAGVAELKAAQRKLAQYRQSLLKAAVEGALTADWRAARARSCEPQETGADLLQRILTERRARWEAKQSAKYAEQGKSPPKGWQAKYPEPTEPSDENHLGLPTSWTWATVDQISIAQKYGSSSKTGEDASGVPVLRMGNIQDGRLDLTNLKYLAEDHKEFPDLLLDDGDLLFNRTNSPELVGKTAVYRSEITPCSYASYLIGVKLNSSCCPEFVSAFINSAFGRAWVKEVVTQQVGQANVNGSKLASLAVPLPPRDEQQEIIARLDYQLRASFHEQAMIERGLEQAAAQRKNILKAAFAGQLVPQDPNDEPASVLLERIRAERAKQTGAAKPRGRKPRTSA